MASKQQIDRIAQRIEALGRPTQQGGPHLGVVFQMPGQTVEQARRTHALRYPEDEAGTMMVIRWPPIGTPTPIAATFNIPYP